jgi:hypothetical protein
MLLLGEQIVMILGRAIKVIAMLELIFVQEEL